jgi:transposase
VGPTADLDTAIRSLDRPARSQYLYPDLHYKITNNNLLENEAQFKNFFRLSSKNAIINPLNPELNPICYLLALLAHHFLDVSSIKVK